MQIDTSSTKQLLVKDIGQKDEISAYPFALLVYPYPTKFFDLKPFTQKEFDYYYSHRDKWAMIFEVAFKDIELKDPEATPVPYISTSKCEKLAFHSGVREEAALEVDNGRVLSAAALTTICTEIDYQIISKQYKWKEEVIYKVKVSRKKDIPKELKEQILDFFMKKTSLKQDEASPDFDPEKAYNYAKAKNMVNGIYGMHVTNPIKHDYLINNTNEYLLLNDGTEVPPHCLYQDDSMSDEDILADYYTNFSSFLSYQVGIWVTAYARLMLEEGIDACYNYITKRSDLIYCDTDSCKYINKELHEAAFEAINEHRKALCEEKGAYIDYNGKRWYLGLFDSEPDALAFKTFGAKKYMYAYRKGDKIDYKITISGVPKAAGKACIDEAIKKGKIKSFLDVGKGFIFHGIKTTSCYMELDCLNCYEVEEGKNVYYSSNVAMYPNSYTLGLTYDFELLLEKFKDYM